MSKWPIVQQEQHIYKKAVGLIWQVIKALPTLKLIRMANTTILSEHIYKLKIQHALKEKIKDIRQSQMNEIKQFIKDKNIPKMNPSISG